MKKYIAKFWFFLIIGILLTRYEVERMYEVRGGFYIGGEWLTVPLIILVTVFVPQMVREMFDIYKEDEDAGEIMGDN